MDPMSTRFRPLIGITGRRWPASRVATFLPAALHDAEIDVHFTEYPAAIARAGGLPVELTRDAPVAEMLARLDGVVISGGADVDPANYGHAPHARLGQPEPERDDWELAVIAEALRTGVPLLGICRGAQLLQVHLGGALVQHVDLDDGVGHPRFDEQRSVPCHLVEFAAGTLAHSLYGDAIQVNSLHHQTIESVATGLVASGTALDGVIEAVELPGHIALGVQWHPEMLADLDPSLVWLVDAAARRARLPPERRQHPSSAHADSHPPRSSRR
jgi:putative glutamine amidotransferase